jgi:hypothetical protein
MSKKPFFYNKLRILSYFDRKYNEFKSCGFLLYESQIDYEDLITFKEVENYVVAEFMKEPLFMQALEKEEYLPSI